MGPASNKLTVFTKPWPDPSLQELAKLVRDLEFDGVELTVRPGYQVTPDQVASGLKEASGILADHGLTIGSVAGPMDEATVAACGENGVPIIRVCLGVDLNIGYFESERRIRRQFDALVPALEDAGVAIGVQNHSGNMIASAIGLMHLIEGYDPKHVCAVLDPAHCAVDGETEEMGLDIAWSHLRLVNLKAASHRRTNRPTAQEATWEILWTTSQHSGYSWRKMVRLLRERSYAGDICLPAEYSTPEGHGQLMGNDVLPNLRYDMAYTRFLLSTDLSEEDAVFHPEEWR
jgi:sugar phosphate isomerase/epimerase